MTDSELNREIDFWRSRRSRLSVQLEVTDIRLEELWRERGKRDLGERRRHDVPPEPRLRLRDLFRKG